ncbi:hypothetical protein [Sutcliffiella rhizosphaerae]|uniref:Uncharacterized protein n=1 Tax=Sutcliffiella rhizosphaerae TaxID=2880967 RepID=A0ABN8AD42_9BACI|nr:hypothetical protein [Sutcliffiella rhizosphaerae]CAG9622166.1 hypothetical protein BACCIP111883_02957 [Sutcliffiella rhizosphaerae]
MIGMATDIGVGGFFSAGAEIRFRNQGKLKISKKQLNISKTGTNISKKRGKISKTVLKISIK